MAHYAIKLQSAHTELGIIRPA